MREKYLLQLEMSAPDYVIAMTAPGDTERGMHRLVDALSEIDSELAKYKESESIYAKSREIGIELQENLQIYSSSELISFEIKEKRSRSKLVADMSLRNMHMYIRREFL